MMRILKKYRFRIILLFVLFALTFWLIPAQEKHYTQADFLLLKEGSQKLLNGTFIVGTIALLLFVIRGVSRKENIGMLVLNVLVFMAPLYLVLNPIFLSAFLLLNSWGGKATERQFILTFFQSGNVKSPMLYDPASRKIALDSNDGLEKLKNGKSGEIITVTYRQGLLGYNYNAFIK